jgi:orotate phosphoribosyltransferase
MISIFDYGFPETEELFKKNKVELISLSDYHSLIKKALEMGYVKEDQMEILLDWRKAPSTWGK